MSARPVGGKTAVFLCRQLTKGGLASVASFWKVAQEPPQGLWSSSSLGLSDSHPTSYLEPTQPDHQGEHSATCRQQPWWSGGEPPASTSPLVAPLAAVSRQCEGTPPTLPTDFSAAPSGTPRASTGSGLTGPGGLYLRRTGRLRIRKATCPALRVVLGRNADLSKGPAG